MSSLRHVVSWAIAISTIAGTALVVSAHEDVTDPGPVGVIAIGHSGLTAENSDPVRPWQPALENSWATGTNPEVRSIYQRLVEIWPETEGHVANTAQGGAPALTLASQAGMALRRVPAPALVIVQSLDGDIRCDGTDAAHVPEFGMQVAAALELITEASPRSRILVLSQLGDPAAEAQALADDPAAVEALKGEGMCDFFDRDGTYRPDRVAALTAIIEAYEAEQARVCAGFPQCRDDRGEPADVTFDRSRLTDDGNHLNVAGQAHLAELRWPAVAELLGITAEAMADGPSLVGLGDSLPGALGCFGHCQSYVESYGELAASALGQPVVTTNLATNDGLTSDTLLQRVTHDQRHRELLADADLITVQIGRNNWEGSCMFDDMEVCLAGNRDAVEQDLRAILAEVAQLRGERPTAVRVLGYYDPFVGKAQTPQWWGFDPSQRDAFDAAYATALIDFNAMLCRVAEESHAICIDTHTLVNGPAGDIEALPEPADGALVLGGDDQLHLTAAGHQLVAGAIADAGFAPLG